MLGQRRLARTSGGIIGALRDFKDRHPTILVEIWMTGVHLRESEGFYEILIPWRAFEQTDPPAEVLSTYFGKMKNA